MNKTDIEDEATKVASLAEKYRSNGFEVLIQPSENQMPFDLGRYRPDLIAKKNGNGLVIEVISGRSKQSLDRFRGLAEEVAKHSGWHFLLSPVLDAQDSLNSLGAYELPTYRLPTWDETVAKISRANALLQTGDKEPALLFVWSVFEAALRRRAKDQNIPIEQMSASSLLKHLYSQGEISVDDIDGLKNFLAARNVITHGGEANLNDELLTNGFESISRLVAEWSGSPTLHVSS